MVSARLPGPSRCEVFARLLGTALVLGFAYRVFAGALPSVVGDWRGSLHPGEQTLRLELHVNSDAQEKLDVTLESVDQGEEVLTGSECSSTAKTSVSMSIRRVRLTEEG